MKKIVILICIVFTSLGSFAQHGPRERVKAYKVGYITEKLNLTSKEAQNFWPIYNDHEKTIENIRKRERKLIKAIKDTNNSPNGIDDKQADEFLNTHLETEIQKSEARQKLILDLKKVIPNKKILRLVKAEADFNKRILEKIRERRRKN